MGKPAPTVERVVSGKTNNGVFRLFFFSYEEYYWIYFGSFLGLDDRLKEKILKS